MKHRDMFVLEKIVQYANEIELTISELKLDFDKFKASSTGRNAVSMCILQIGELASNLSKEFIKSHSTIQWRSIISMRNRAAHGYWDMSKEIIWQTATEDVPPLKIYCQKILGEYK